MTILGQAQEGITLLREAMRLRCLGVCGPTCR